MRLVLAALAAAVAAAAAAAAAPAYAAPASQAAQWVTLGTAGGPPIRATQSQIANALVVGDAVYLFDAGEGVLGQMAAARLPIGKLRALFLTHHHFDHTASVGPVIVSYWNTGGRDEPLRIIGPPGAKHLAEGLARANTPVEVASYPVYGRARPPIIDLIAASDLPRTMNEPTPVYEDENIRVTAITINHFDTPPSEPVAEMPTAVAYRIESGGRSIVYTGDTGRSANLIKLAKDADLLVSEVVDIDSARAAALRNGPIPPAQEATFRNWTLSHSPSEVVGEAAAAANVKAVVLTHYVGSWETEDMSGFTKGVADRYKGPIHLAHDLDRF